MKNWTKSLLEGAGALAIIGTFCAAVGIKISELPVSEDPPSDNTYIEIADMDQAVKSRKLLLTNLSFRANTATQFVQNFFVTNITQVGGDTYISNVTQVIEQTTTYVTNVTQIINNTTNYFTNVTQVFETNIFNIKNSTVTITNTTVTINGSNVATINPTDKYIPYRGGSNYFGDSTMFHEDGVTKVDANVGVVLTAGDAAFFNVLKASQTNAVSGAVAITHMSNGIANVELTYMRKWQNSSGSDETLSLPINSAGVDGWLTNQNTGEIPGTITNGSIIRVLCRVDGPTDTLARQTNVTVLGFEYPQ